MKSFKEFFESRSKDYKNGALKLSGEKIRNQLILASKSNSFSITEENAEEFSDKVSNLVANSKFINKLSQSIGQPRSNESQEAFVARSKAIMKKLLKEKLS